MKIFRMLLTSVSESFTSCRLITRYGNSNPSTGLNTKRQLTRKPCRLASNPTSKSVRNSISTKSNLKTIILILNAIAVIWMSLKV